MDSPSAQLVEPSMIDFDGPPSSPFVTEVETASRRASKQRKPSMAVSIAEEETGPVAVEILPNAHVIEVQNMYDEDKENVGQQDATATLAKMFASPKKPSTPEQTPATNEKVRSSDEAVLMPPPSTRKASGSPKKTPLQPRKSAATTPKSLSRGNSFERTPAQNASAFQAGLDLRNSTIPAQDAATSVDDTCFSTFSEMSVFRPSPTKRGGDALRTPHGIADFAPPRTSRKRSSSSRSPSPTPRRQKTPAPPANKDETTSFLIDFTQQIEGVHSYRQPSPTKSSTESNLLQYINNQRSPHKPNSTARSTPATTTPSKPNPLLNLLDFELPPAPTPRSIPTITVRELESLKSTYLSQISSLKATLSGREAEVDSLKKAVNDAERRVGEAQEGLREEKSRREHVEQAVGDWKRRGEEFEVVLRSVREEVLRSEGEREEMTRLLEEAGRRGEEAEGRAVRAEERFADALAARAGGEGEGDGSALEAQVQRLVGGQIDAKVEAVSRELHAVYKEKHERKVATLKKSYEARNEKKTVELTTRLAELEKANEELQVAKDATFSGPVPNQQPSILASVDAELKAQLEEHRAALARLDSEIHASRSQHDALARELKQERIEKGDLVAAVDEMLALQGSGEGAAPPTPGGARAMSVVEDFRKSIGRPVMRGAGGGGGESRIGMVGRGLPTPTGGLGRSLSGSLSGSGGGSGSGSAVGKSRMLANIERMGRAGGQTGQGGGGVE